MTDSENENNPSIFPFKSVDTTVNAFGPNIRYQRPFRFPNNGSSMYMPRRNYAESVSEQRSMYYRRETSPMSTYSALDSRAWNFSQYNGIRSTQSVFNGRCGSSMSVRSIDTTASASVADIIFAFKNNKFSKHDEKAIEEAFRKWRKQRSRKRIQIRRDMKFNLKDNKSRVDYDSGEQGSDSSISSHNSHSGTVSYKESRPTKIDMLDSRRANKNKKETTIPAKDNNGFISLSQSFRQQAFNNKFPMNNNRFNQNQNVNSTLISNKPPIATQQVRFKNTMALPSQRFNSNISSINNKSEISKKGKESNNKQSETLTRALHDLSEEGNSNSDEEIFSGTNKTIREKIAHDWIVQNQKRNTQAHLNKRLRNSDDDINLPNGKKSRTLSPVKNSQLRIGSKTRDSNPVNRTHNNFEFPKPLLPVRRLKTKSQEKFTSKPVISPIKVNTDKVSNSVTVQADIHLEKSQNNAVNHLDSITTQNEDISMRPSFIKRKLFTQKLDIAEKANTSNDNAITPQKDIYQKEKNKIRKVVTSQSCLNRDIQEDNNYLDLIHKIVPAGSINVTNQAMASQIRDKTAKNDDEDDKWDVASVISVCNENEGSDTFTDEDIFKVDSKKIGINKNKTIAKNNNTKHNMTTHAKCVVNLQKIDMGKSAKVGDKLNISKCISNLIPNKKSGKGTLGNGIGKSFAKKFWESDFETDIECETTLQKNRVQEIQTVFRDNNHEAPPIPEEKRTTSPVETEPPPRNQTKNNITTNNVLYSTGKLNVNLISVKSHRTLKKKNCCNETSTQEPAPKHQSTPKIQMKNFQHVKASTPKKSKKNTADQNTNTVPQKNTSDKKSKAVTQNNSDQKTNTEPQKNKNTTDIKTNTGLQKNRNTTDQKTNTVPTNNKNKKIDTPKRANNTKKIKSNANKENICKYLLPSPIRRSPRIKSIQDNNNRLQRSCRINRSVVI